MTEHKPTAYRLKTGKVAENVVGAYQDIEDAVVGAYKKIEDAFVDRFLEPVEDASACSVDASSVDEASGDRQ